MDICHPSDLAAVLPEGESLSGYDGIAITGSALHVYNGGSEVMRQVDLVRAALATGAPVFGSCWGFAGDHCGGRRQRAQKSAWTLNRFWPSHQAD